MEEYILTDSSQTHETTTLSPEILVARLGDYLVEKRLISSEELKHALELQARFQQEGKKPQLLGKILIQIGAIDAETLDQAITEQIIQLKTALQDANRQLERRVQERTAELELALKKLSELNQLKSDFVSNISHELRTPLTHIKGYLELIYSEELGPLQAEQMRALAVTRQSSDRLEHLIEDLIQFSMAEPGQITLNLRIFDLPLLCQKIAKQATVKARAHDLQFVPQIPQASLFVKADEEKISWLIEQLIDNAIKFTSAGGTIQLSICFDDPFLKIIVQDTGIGMAPEKIPQIFQPFHQLNGGASRRYGGTGLGLALARNIAEAHGTILYVVSEVGKGSEFSFNLRVVHQEA
ncbi:MAG: hypothetical protein IT308_11230 [Anaerolineaceae bacterium]|nr:hypothetical protein [Anaerolineaceae bacterium]